MSSTTQQYLSFMLGRIEYALPIVEVREVVRQSTITPVPSMPPAIRGVINLRGQVLPVLDVAMRVGLPQTAIGRWTCTMVVDTTIEGERCSIGLLVDAVSRVHEFAPEQIGPPPSFGSEISVDYLKGMASFEKSFVQILSLDRLLAREDLLGALVGNQSAVNTAKSQPTASPRA